jgi:hypothetical protein
MEHALHSSGRDSMGFGNLTDTLSPAAFALDGFMIEYQGLSTDVRAFEAGAAHAGAHPLNDQAAFEFCDGGDDDDDGPAQRTGGVDIFPEADELDVETIEFIQDFKVVLDGASDPVASPDQNNIEVAAAGIGHHMIQSGAACLHAADPVRIFLNDVKTTLSGHLTQIMKLGLGVLIDGRDSHIEDGTLHLRRPFGLGAYLTT